MQQPAVEFSDLDFSPGQIRREAERLYEHLRHAEFSLAECELIAPLTLEINRLKEEKRAVILAHSYQTPDIIYGIADYSGDSLGLSRHAAESEAEVIVFCGVRFMAETAKVLSPHKTVLHPAPDAGCSLADSITAGEVRRLKAEHPGVPVVCYINTSAEVKAESDACCTSANALEVIEAMEGDEVIFIPDQLMAQNLQPYTKKRLITWQGTCIVHENFMAETVDYFKRRFPDLKVLVHTECDAAVVAHADLAGSTGNMVEYVRSHHPGRFMLVTECGLADRLRVEFPESEFIGSCVLCPYMKRINLRNVLQCMKEPRPEQIVELPEEVIRRARRAIDRMLEIGRGRPLKVDNGKG